MSDNHAIGDPSWGKVMPPFFVDIILLSWAMSQGYNVKKYDIEAQKICRHNYIIIWWQSHLILMNSLKGKRLTKRVNSREC